MSSKSFSLFSQFMLGCRGFFSMLSLLYMNVLYPHFIVLQHLLVVWRKLSPIQDKKWAASAAVKVYSFQNLFFEARSSPQFRHERKKLRMICVTTLFHFSGEWIMALRSQTIRIFFKFMMSEGVFWMPRWFWTRSLWASDE